MELARLLYPEKGVAHLFSFSLSNPQLLAISMKSEDSRKNVKGDN